MIGQLLKLLTIGAVDSGPAGVALPIEPKAGAIISAGSVAGSAPFRTITQWCTVGK